MKPIHKKYWGADLNDNIKIQFHNGTESVRGYILKQKASRRFECKDENGNLAICDLVDKNSEDLQEGEMSITVKFDNGTVKHIVKITSHLVYFTDSTYAPWNFSTSTSDGYVEIEEAGTNPAMDDATDLEGDDVNIGADYPSPFSGNYRTAAVALNGITYATLGTPYEPNGSKTNAETASYGGGLRRVKYDGNFCAANNTPSGSWNYSWFGTTTLLGEAFDTAISWGQQSDGPVTPGGSLFSMEWKGWVQVPATQDYNWYGESDDHMAVWIGQAATNAPSNGSFLFAGNNKSLPADANNSATYSPNSITMDSTKWYPIRIWFSEFTGGCKCQIYLHGANGAKYNGEDLLWRYNPLGEGW